MSRLDENPDGPVIPRILHSVYSGGPFTHCVDCGQELLKTGTPHAVEKVVRHEDVVFEYAICAPCVMTILKEYSQESIQRIRSYLEQEPLSITESQMIDQLLWSLGRPTEGGVAPPPSPPADHCHCCGGTEGFEDEHTISALLVGPHLATGLSTLCGRCVEGMEDLLSEKTRQVHEDFIQRNFPGVPAGLDLPAGIVAL